MPLQLDIIGQHWNVQDKDMFCSNCGKATENSDRFCSRCGQSTIQNSSKTKKAYHLAIALLLTSLLAIIPFAIEYFSHKADWRQAKGSDSIDAYQVYMRAWPDGAHLTQATRRITEIQHEDDWTVAISEGTIASFNKFLTKWPTTKKTHQIETQTWEITESENSIYGFKNFISMWAEHESKYLDVAEEKLQALLMQRDWSIAQSTNEIEGFETFITKWPNSDLVGKARERIIFIEAYQNTKFNVEYIMMPRPFTFNVSGQSRNRLVQIKMVLKVQKKRRQDIEKYIPLAEGIALRIFSKQTVESLMKKGAFLSVKQDVLTELTSTGSLDGLKDVLFTGFVMQ